MKINSTILADVLAGLGGHGEPGDPNGGARGLFKEIQKDPRLRELLWHLEYVSRAEGKLDALVSGFYQRRTTWYDDVDVFNNTIKLLQGHTYSDHHAGELPEPIKAGIYKAMTQHAVAAKSALAETKVSNLIFKELDLALRHKVPVPIIGDSRFGKTKGISVWCEMRPGRSRVVTVPESNREWDFLAAHADAFGIEYNYSTPVQKLKRAVQWVVQNSGLFICYDEAHFLTPVNYAKDTPPKRINWVRCQVIDKGVGCAFFATPQSLNQSLEKYAAKTKYNLEQWIGRLAPAVVLADYYDRDELMAVAAVHFPDFPQKLLALICSRAMQSEGYLKSMEFTARYASALASERGHRTPAIQDVDEAIQRMMPHKAQVSSLANAQTAAKGRLKPSLTPASDPFLDDAGEVDTSDNFAARRPGLDADLVRAGQSRTTRTLVPA